MSGLQLPPHPLIKLIQWLDWARGKNKTSVKYGILSARTWRVPESDSLQRKLDSYWFPSILFIIWFNHIFFSFFFSLSLSLHILFIIVFSQLFVSIDVFWLQILHNASGIPEQIQGVCQSPDRKLEGQSQLPGNTNLSPVIKPLTRIAPSMYIDVELH